MGLLSLLGSNPYVTGAKVAIVAVAVSAVVGYVLVERHAATVATARAVAAEKALDEYQASAVAVIKERLAEQTVEADRVAQAAKEVEDAHQRNVADLNAYYAKRLRELRQQNANNSGGAAAVPTPGDAPSGSDAAPVVADPTDRFVHELQECDIDREKLRNLQLFLNERGY